MKKEWLVKDELMDSIERAILYESLDKSLIVSGCAGSGKSLMAVKLAERIENEKKGKRRIVVYTKALEEYIREGTRTLNLNCNLTHYDRWKWKTVEEWNEPNQQYYYVKKENCPHADYFIVDEIQDFSKDEVQSFIKATDKHFLFFGDTAQSIYKEKNPLPVKDIKKTFGLQDSQCKEYLLYYNYRLPVHIAEAVQYVGEDLEEFDPNKYKSPEKTYLRMIKYKDKESHIVDIGKYCAEKRSSDIAIIVPHKLDVINIYNQLKGLGVYCEMKYDDPHDFHKSIDTLDMSTDNPKIMTFHSAKGLQFETVFIPWINDNPLYMRTYRTPLYVAMTRTCRDLFLMHTGWLPHPLAAIPQNLYKTTMFDIVEDK